MPLTRPKEQYLDLQIVNAHGLAETRTRWDHVTGYLPLMSEPTCGISYPLHEGPTGGRAMSPIFDLWRPRGDSLPPVARGAPLHVRVQLFPDGRCGDAVKHEKPWVSRRLYAPLDSETIVVQGNSVATRMLVGHLMVRAGVPADVDWSGTHASRP